MEFAIFLLPFQRAWWQPSAACLKTACPTEGSRKKKKNREMVEAVRTLPAPLNWSAARWPRPDSDLRGQLPLRTGLAEVEVKCTCSPSYTGTGLWKMDKWVLPALPQMLSSQKEKVNKKRWRKKKGRQLFAEDGKTKDVDKWKNVPLVVGLCMAAWLPLAMHSICETKFILFIWNSTLVL